VIVAEVVERPVGVVQVPLAVVQYRNSIEATAVAEGGVKLKRCFTTPLGLDPSSVAPA